MARDKNPTPTKKVEEFGVADGFDFNFSESNEPNEDEITTPAKITSPIPAKPIQPITAAVPEPGQNPYYNYHPKTGARGRSLGAPRKTDRRTQISIGCSEADKQLYTAAAAADGRKLPDFINTAVKEYIRNHNLT